MKDDPSGPRPSTRARTLASLALLAVLAASLFWSVHPWYDPTNDGSMYIATARSLAAGEGYSYLGSPFVIRPPGFACLIAPLFALLGTNFLALNLTVSLFGALGVFLFHLQLRERLGLVLACLVPLVLWFNPGYQRLCNQVMSDVPGWACLLACAGLARPFLARPSAGRGAVLGVSIACASLVRSGNALLLPALLAAGLAQQRAGRASAVSRRTSWRAHAALWAAALVLLGAWSVRNRVRAAPPPADQTMLYSYATGMWHEDMADPRSPRVPWSGILARFPVQGQRILDSLGTRLGEGPASRAELALASVLLAALALVALRRGQPEELFALATLLVVGFYFGYATRLLVPVFAFALAALFELVRAAGGRVLGARSGTLVAAGLCLVWIGLDWRPREGWSEIRALHEEYTALASQVRAELPPEARLGAYRGWHHSVYLERPVYSLELAFRRAGDPSGAAEVIQRHDLDHLLLTPLGLPDPIQPVERALARTLARARGVAASGLVRLR